MKFVISVLLIISGTVVVSGGYPVSGDQFVMKIDGHKSDRMLIYNKLQSIYERMFDLQDKKHAILYLGNAEQERKCIGDTEFRYFLKQVLLDQKDYEASECRININPDYLVVLTPTNALIDYIHHINEPLVKQLETRIINKLSNTRRLSHLQFYNFSNLNEDIECIIDYQEISQVKLRETVVKVKLEEVSRIPDSCGFQRIDKYFDGEFVQTMELDIPLNGTFYCKKGTSSTCKKSIAEHRSPKLKLTIN